jgi:heme-degrading monooxygenase HmoA
MIERQLKKREDIGRLLLELRMAAMPRKGYVSGETLVSTKSGSTILVISTWQSLEQWKAWETSEERAKINRKIEPLLSRKPAIKIYQVLSSEELEYLEDPEGWMHKKERLSLDG